MILGVQVLFMLGSAALVGGAIFQQDAWTPETMMTYGVWILLLAMWSREESR